MIQQKEINVGKLLRMNRMGVWRIEIEDGKSPRFYADAVMDELIGIQEKSHRKSDLHFIGHVYIRMICSYFWNTRINCQKQDQKLYIVIFIRHQVRGLYAALVQEICL